MGNLLRQVYPYIFPQGVWNLPFSIRSQLRDVRLTDLQNTGELMAMSIRINKTWSFSYPCWLAIKMHWPQVVFWGDMKICNYLLCLMIRFMKWGMRFIAYLHEFALYIWPKLLTLTEKILFCFALSSIYMIFCLTAAWKFLMIVWRWCILCESVCSFEWVFKLMFN